jgi:DNA repair protein RadC
MKSSHYRKKDIKNHHTRIDKTSSSGHRLRLKNKFFKTSADSLYEYEILELLLFYSIPRIDVKPLAKLLLHKFGNLANLFNAHPSKLSEIPGIGQNTIIFFKLIKETLLLTNKEQIIKKPILNSWEKLILYLRANIGYDSVETLKALYLNSKNILLGEAVYDSGTVNKICVYPREILKSALYYEATSVLLVHNHPSGMTKASKTDIDVTLAIQKALKTLDIILIDHVIVSPNNEFSFKANALL